MKFVGYTSGEMIGVAHIIHAYKDNYVITDGGQTKLAIKLPSCNNVQLFALFLWNDYNNENVDATNDIIISKAEETITFFQETTAVINDYLPRLIYHEVMTILRFNNGSVGRYQSNQNTDILLNENGNSLGYDIGRRMWLVNVGGIVTISLDNENSARQVYRLISRDISNYLSFRWGKP
ncbi:MAG: hypothetical protein IKX44_12280 [Prevotella sp.]|nr:hypothetical protein [Prevotella sp.]